MRIDVVEAPKELPVKVIEAREHLKADAERDAEILRLLYAATEWAESFTARAWITQTLECVLPAFPLEPVGIRLPRSPLQSVVSLKYRDLANVEQTMPAADYQVDTNQWAPRILLADGKSWPATFARVDAVTARIKVGYGGAAKVPFQAQAACLLHVEAHFDRDDRMMEKLLDAAERLLWPLAVTRA